VKNNEVFAVHMRLYKLEYRNYRANKPALIHQVSMAKNTKIQF
jgi:hypothetical protein